jgi:1-acyl-sn-glycerol-3-phosphate acyltransferase
VIERLFAKAPTAPVSDLWLWRAFSPLVRFVAFSLVRVAINGAENVPRSGAYILVANHTSWKDPPVVSLALRTPIRWMAKTEVFDYFFLGFLLRGIGNFAIRRGESDRPRDRAGPRRSREGSPARHVPRRPSQRRAGH